MTEYKVIRSARKTIGLQLGADLQLVVRAPYAASEQSIAQAVEQNRRWIERTRERLRARPPHPEPTAQRIAELREQARRYIPQRVAHFSALMGLYPTAVKITAARSRFGSCSGKNSLCFSLYLMQHPPECIDYVVVHELAHIAHHNHSAEFYALVARYLPDYKNLQKKLKYGNEQRA